MSNPIVDWAIAADAADLDAEARSTMTSAMTDALACAVAGTSEGGARAVREWVDDLGGASEAAILGSTSRAPAGFAALVNATAAHALDLDDVAMTMIHPSATLAPVLFALGERQRSSGAEVLTAYLAGFEVMTRICRVINPDHYARGWHTMQSVGVLGTAIAAGRLLELGPRELAHALGIAASSAGGIRKNFGTMVKPLHGGHAAFHGVEAAELARRGFTADPDVLVGRHGFLQVFSAPDREEALLRAFEPGAPLELATSGIAIKRFACCGAIHTALDSLEELRRSGDFEVGDIRRVECRVNPLTPEILVHHDARTGLEGKFSIEYSAAVMLLTGRAGLAEFDDARAADPELRALMDKIEMVVDDALPIDLAFFPTIVSIELADGRRLTRRTDAQHGYPHDPLTAEELTAKVLDCCRPLLAEGRIRLFLDAMSRLDEIASVGEIAALLVPASTD